MGEECENPFIEDKKQLQKCQWSRQQREWLEGKPNNESIRVWPDREGEPTSLQFMVDIKPFSLLLADHIWKLTPTGILKSGSMRVSTTMFIYLSVILSIGLLSYPLVIHLPVHISVSLPIHLSLHMFTMHLASVCPLVCLLMSLFPTILQKIVSGLQKTHTINRRYICA